MLRPISESLMKISGLNDLQLVIEDNHSSAGSLYIFCYDLEKNEDVYGMDCNSDSLGGCIETIVDLMVKRHNLKMSFLPDRP